jgi:hypothetical protein
MFLCFAFVSFFLFWFYLLFFFDLFSGDVLCNALVNAGISSFETLHTTDPRRIELAIFCLFHNKTQQNKTKQNNRLLDEDPLLGMK